MGGCRFPPIEVRPVADAILRYHLPPALESHRPFEDGLDVTLHATGQRHRFDVRYDDYRFKAAPGELVRVDIGHGVGAIWLPAEPGAATTLATRACCDIAFDDWTTGFDAWAVEPITEAGTACPEAATEAECQCPAGSESLPIEYRNDPAAWRCLVSPHVRVKATGDRDGKVLFAGERLDSRGYVPLERGADSLISVERKRASGHEPMARLALLAAQRYTVHIVDGQIVRITHDGPVL